MNKRDAVCDAALSLFAEKGIEATTIREIAARAGAAEGTLYRHFDGKDDLAAWLYNRCASQLRDRLAERVDGTTTPPERLEGLIRGLFDFFTDQPTSCTYLLSAHSDTGDSVAERGDEATPPPMRLFVDALDDGMDAGAFRSGSAQLAAGWILAMVQRTVLFLKSGRLDVDKEEAVDRTVDAALRLVTESAPSLSN